MFPAHAFINPTRSRPKLSIRTDTVVSKVLLEGRHARGVVCSPDGSAETLREEREVILAAGAFHSPQLLILSGVGPADHLGDHALAVAHELPGVVPLTQRSAAREQLPAELRHHARGTGVERMGPLRNERVRGRRE